MAITATGQEPDERARWSTRASRSGSGDDRPLTDPRVAGAARRCSTRPARHRGRRCAGAAAWRLRVAADDRRAAALRGRDRAGDNRAEPRRAREGGEPRRDRAALGDRSLRRPRRGADPAAIRDPAADALLSEILPAPTQSRPRRSSAALPGPQTIGLGLLPGPGTGGGGGLGRRLGRRRRPRDRPRHRVLRRPRARPLVRLRDRLLRAAWPPRNSLDVAKRELLASLDQLPPDAQFARHLLQPPGHASSPTRRASRA